MTLSENAQHLIKDARDEPRPKGYGGDDPCRCLFGAMIAGGTLNQEFIDFTRARGHHSYTPRGLTPEFIADMYNLPLLAIEDVWLKVAEEGYRDSLEASIGLLVERLEEAEKDGRAEEAIGE